MAGTTTNTTPAARTGMQPRQVAEFFLLLPLSVGLFLGAARVGGYQFVTPGHHMAYMAIYSVVSWACYGIASKVAATVLRPWSPPLLLVLVVGQVVGGLTLLWPLRDLLNPFFEVYLLPGSRFGRFWPPPPDRLAGYVAITAQGMAWWLLANWLDFRFRGVPRFGFVPPERPGPAPAAATPATATSGDGAPADPGDRGTGNATADAGRPRLAGRLPERLRDADILALEAEEHYTKVHTARGSTLILLRFSDAIAEMGTQPGLQVHRSFWISRHAVERVSRSDRRLVVRLRGGLEVPVSRSFRLTVQAAALPGALATDE